MPIADIQGTGDRLAAGRPERQDPGCRHRGLPDRWAERLLHPDTRALTPPNASDAVFVYGGSSGFTTYPAVGDSVEVTGQAAEFSGQTQVVANDAGVVQVAALGAVTPKTVIPGTDCALPGTDCLAGAALDTAREVAEGESFKPTAPWTATDVYDGGPYYSDGTNSSAFRGELGVAANSSKPLVAPTEVIDAQATALVAERKRYNDAHRIILDDASSLDVLHDPEQRLAVPVVHGGAHRAGRRWDHLPPAGRVHLRLQRLANPAAVPDRREHRPARSTSPRPGRLPPRTWVATSSSRRSTS